MSMNEYLPTICDEVIFEDEYHKITKIAEFDKECRVHTFGDKWYIRPDWTVEYTLTEYGRKIRPYEKDKLDDIKHNVKETSDVESLLREQYEDVYPINNFYLCRKTIDDVIHSSLLDSKGEKIVEGLFFLSYGNILCEERNRIAFFIGNRCGVMDFEGNVRVIPKYRNISDLFGDLIVMVDDGNYYFITDQGDLIWKHRGLVSMADDLITIWDDKPKVLKYECKQKPKEKASYIHVNDLQISEEEKPRISDDVKRLIEKLKSI